MFFSDVTFTTPILRPAVIGSDESVVASPSTTVRHLPALAEALRQEGLSSQSKFNHSVFSTAQGLQSEKFVSAQPIIREEEKDNSIITSAAPIQASSLTLYQSRRHLRIPSSLSPVLASGRQLQILESALQPITPLQLPNNNTQIDSAQDQKEELSVTAATKSVKNPPVMFVEDVEEMKRKRVLVWRDLIRHMAFQYSAGSTVMSIFYIAYCIVRLSSDARLGFSQLLNSLLFVGHFFFFFIAHLFLYSHMKLAKSISLERFTLELSTLRIVLFLNWSIGIAGLTLLFFFPSNPSHTVALSRAFFTMIAIMCGGMGISGYTYLMSLKSVLAADVSTLNHKQQTDRRLLVTRLKILVCNRTSLQLVGFDALLVMTLQRF